MTPANDAPRLTYQPGLDGLRGIAVLAVLLFHAELTLGGTTLAVGGYLGVSTFFTLSGYLITTLILLERERTGGVSLRRFWGRRLRRLMPAALLALGLVILYAATVASDPGQLGRLRGDLLGSLFYVANWRFMATGQDYAALFSDPSPVLHFWSLAIEEQFYLFFPLVAAGALAVLRGSRSRFGLLLALGAATSGALMLVLSVGGSDLSRLYYGTDTRAAELLVGALLAVILFRWSTGTRQWGHGRLVQAGGVAALGLTVAAYAAVPLTSTWLYRGGLFAFALVSAALISAAVAPSGPVRAILSVRALRALGLISYGVYLYHWPVYLWLSPERTGMDPWALLPARLAVTLALATASYVLVEVPIRRRQLLVKPRQLVAAPLAVVVVLAGTFLVTQDPPEDPLAVVAAEIPPPPAPPEPVPDPLSLLVVGDDLADLLADELARWDAGEPVEVRAITNVGCGSGTAALEVDGSEFVTCERWLHEWSTALDEQDPDLVVVAVAAWNLPHLFAAEGEAALEILPELRRRAEGALALLASRGAETAVAVFPHAHWHEQHPHGADTPTMAAVLRETTLAGGKVELAAAAPSLPPFDPTAPEEWAREVTSQLGPGLIELAEQRRARQEAPRIMVVGDSVARSLGIGLETWARDHGDVAVWNTGTNGCGIARGGERPPLWAEPPDQDICERWGTRWAEQLDEFDPHVVVVLTGAWDLTDRRLPDWDGFRSIGDPDFDAYLLSEYETAVDLLSSRGARVVWLTAPCAGEIFPGPLKDDPALSAERTAALNQQILPRLLERRPDVQLADLFSQVCPAGAFDSAVGGMPGARPDGLHFSAQAAHWVAEWLGPQLVER